MSTEEGSPGPKLGKLFNPAYKHPGMTKDGGGRSMRGQLFRPVSGDTQQPGPSEAPSQLRQTQDLKTESPKLPSSTSPTVSTHDKAKLVPQFTKSFSGFFGARSPETAGLRKAESVESLGSDGEGHAGPTPNSSLSQRLVQFMFQQPVRECGECGQVGVGESCPKAQVFEPRKDVEDCGCANPLPFYKKLNAIAPTSL